MLTIDYNLLVATLVLNEALLYHPKQQKIIMRLLDHIVVNNAAKVGQKDLLAFLRDSNFPFVCEVDDILSSTPLGNPAWCLFGNNAELAEKLLTDLDEYSCSINEESPKSLKSIIKDFLKKYPIHGVSNYTDWSIFNNTKFYQSNNKRKTWNYLGSIVSRLILMQALAVPKSKRQKIDALISEGIPLEKALKEVKTKKNNSISRPDLAYYRVAITDMLTGAATLDTDVWQEMLSMYYSKRLTNFLPFAPLLLQPFVHSYLNIPCPNVNTLATLMGNFTGGTGTFMGDITTKESPLHVKWSTLDLSVEKLCKKLKTLNPINLDNSFYHQNKELLSNMRIRVKDDQPSETPKIGVDIGYVILANLGRDVKISDLNISLKLDKIQYKKFTKERRTEVFHTSIIRLRLDDWRRKQLTQKNWVILQPIKCASMSFNRRQMSTPKGITDAQDQRCLMPKTKRKKPLKSEVKLPGFSVLPLPTYIFRHEMKYLTKLTRDRIQHPASKAEGKTKMCLGLNCKKKSFENTLCVVVDEYKQDSICSDALSKTGGLGAYYYYHRLNSCSGESVFNSSESVIYTCALQAASRKSSTTPHGISSTCNSNWNTSTTCNTSVRLGNATPSWITDGSTCGCMIPALYTENMFCYFISKAVKESRCKNECINIRKKRFRELLSEQKRILAEKNIYSHVNNNNLLLSINDILINLNTTSKSLHIPLEQKLTMAFTELLNRYLPVFKIETFSLNILKDDFNYRYILGDEEMLAVVSWFAEDKSGEYSSAFTTTTRAVFRVKVALSLIWVVRWLNKEYRDDWTDNDVFAYDILKKYPLIEDDSRAILSLIPILYWTQVLEKTNPCQHRSLDVKTKLYVPTVTVYKDIEGEKTYDSIQLDEDTYLSELLPYIHISNLALCPYDTWLPETILNNIARVLNMPYSIDINPYNTRVIRKYVFEAYSILIKRLSNKRLMLFLHSTSKLTLDETKLIFKQMRDNLKDWYDTFTSELHANWSLTGHGEWVRLINDKAHDKAVDNNQYLSL